MGDAIREVCAMSVICAVISSLAPEGSVKNIMGVLTAIILMISALSPFVDFDFGVYSEAVLKSRETERRILADSKEMEKRLNRLVIEDEFEAYIMDKAARHGLAVENLHMEMKWSTDGYWLPTGLSGSLRGDEKAISAFTALIETELGIPTEMQNWDVSR